MLPICICADNPLRPLIASFGRPQSGASRGNSKNSTSMIGAPSSAIAAAVLAACARGGRPTGMWAFTSAVSKTQQRDQHRGRGQQRLREKEIRQHREEAEEEDHQRIAPRAQFQGLQREKHHDQGHTGVTADHRAM